MSVWWLQLRMCWKLHDIVCDVYDNNLNLALFKNPKTLTWVYGGNGSSRDDDDDASVDNGASDANLSDKLMHITSSTVVLNPG